VQTHVNPRVVLLVPRLVAIPGPGALLQQRQCDLVVDVLMLEHILVRELHLAVEVVQPGRLAKEDELVVDEGILDVVELVLRSVTDSKNLCIGQYDYRDI
jgi:hypothetical protein